MRVTGGSWFRIASSALVPQWFVVEIQIRFEKRAVWNVTSFVNVRLEVARNESTAGLSMIVFSA